MKTELLSRKPPTIDHDSAPALPIGARRDDSPRMVGPVLPARPYTLGNRDYLRALRAAEMSAWQACGGDAFRRRLTH